jgi:hypothetical protein
VELILYFRKLLVLYLQKEGNGFLLHFCDGYGGKKDSIDSIGTVLSLVKLIEVLPHLGMTQSLVVAD